LCPCGFFTQIRQPDESQFDLVLSMGDGGLVDPFTLVIQPTVYVETASFDACVGADTCKGLGSTVLPPLTEPVPGDETLVCRRGCHAFCGPCTTFNGGR
jgi:hypothetical protein